MSASPSQHIAPAASLDRGVFLFVPTALRHRPSLATRPEHEVALMFVDVAGFTGLSEALAGRGVEGAEVLERTIADYFDGLLDEVERHGGLPLKISGDALTLLFPVEPGGRVPHLSDAVRHAVACADALRRTSPGTEGLAHKIGVGCGRLISGIVGEGRQELVYGGPALEQAVRAEHAATAGEVWLSPEVVQVLADSRLPPAGDAPIRLPDPFVAAAPSREHLHLSPPPATAETNEEAWLSLVPEAVREHARGGTLNWLTRHQSLTVLFVGCPELTLDHPDNLAELDRHYQAMARVVHTHGGFVSEMETGDKGTKLIALFGAPNMLEDATRAAVRCAAEMQEEARRLGTAPSQRIGMCSGRMYVGRVGCRALVKYSALGDRMNLAARLMVHAGPWEVVAEARTAERTGLWATWSAPRRIQVKGKIEAVTVHRLEGLREDAPEQRRGTGLVGRRDELVLLESRLEVLARGSGGILDVAGGPGSGKSRLGMALWRRATEKYQTDVLHWRGQSVERRTDPLAPFGPVLRHALRVPSDAGAAEIRALFRDWVARQPEDRRPTARLLAPLLGLQVMVDASLAGIDGERRQRLTSEALIDALSTACADGIPRVVLLDEAERLEPTCHEVLRGLLGALANTPLLVVLLRRPAEDAGDPLAGFPASPCLVRLVLGPLDLEGTAALTAQRAQVAEVDRELVELIHQRSTGVPLLVESWVDALRDAGRLVVESGTLWLKDGAAVELPDRFEAQVLVRLERLSPEAQTTVRIASVVATPFTPADIAALYPEAPDVASLSEHLASAAAAGLLFRERDHSPYLHFSRVEVKDAVHNSLPFHLRRLLHTARAEQIRAAAQGAPDDEASLILAQHHCYIPDPRAQVEVFGRAADVCRDRFSHREVSRWSRLGLEAAEALGDLPARWRFLHRLQGALGSLGEHAERARLLEQMREVAEALGDAPMELEALTLLARHHVRTGDRERAGVLSEQALAVARARGDVLALASALNVSALIQGELGHGQLGVERGLEALQILPEGEEDLRGQIACNVGFALSGLGRAAEAHAHLVQALAAAERLGNQWHLAVTEGNIGIELWGMGRPEEGHARLLHSLTLKQRLGDRREQALGKLNLGFSWLRLGAPDQARQLTAEALAHFRRLDYGRGILYCLVNLAEQATLSGELVISRGCLEEAAALLQRAPNPTLEAEAAPVSGELALAEGRWEDAAHAFTRALTLAAEQARPATEALGQEGLGFTLHQAGASHLALPHLRRATSLVEVLPSQLSFPQRTFWRASLVADALGDRTQATRWWSQARALVQAQIDPLTEAAARERLARAFPWNRALLEERP